ncbi:MAG: alpha/beta hydrolase [Anaerolineae bacterium]|nr:alpha/beta hydrolase [Anaerolineae bacterium]
MSNMQGFANPRIARLYGDVPADLVQVFLEFRQTHLPERIVLNGVEWEVIAAGQGDQPLLLLPGALGTAVSSWQSILHFTGGSNAARYRLIVPGYPFAIDSMDALVDGIAALLDRQHIDRAFVLGGSGGGFIAQAFTYRHASRVAKLAISLAGPPSPERGTKIAQSLRWMQWLPMFVLRAMLKKSLLGLLDTEDPGITLIAAYTREVIDHHITRQGFLNAFRRMVDFDLHNHASIGTIENWPADMLIMVAEQDRATPEAIRRQMAGLYPQARIHLFAGIGHTAPLARSDEYYATLEAFLGQGAKP